MAGHIDSITIGKYKGTDALEASVIFLIDGQEIRRRWKSPHASRRQTDAWLKEKCKVFLATYGAAQQTQIPTFGAFATEFMERHIESNRLAPASAYKIRVTLRDHLVPLLGAVPISEINEDHVDAVKTRKTRAGEPHAANTINSILQHLVTILRGAVRKKLLAEVPPIKRIYVDDEKFAFYTVDEYEALVWAARGCPRTLAGILLAGDAGLRRGEIVALDWKRVKFDTNQVRVEVADWEGIIGLPKGKKARSVPMSTRLRAALTALQQESSGERVLTRKDEGEGEPITAAVLQSWIRTAQRAAGLKSKGPHILRHTFCSHLAMAGVPTVAIRDLAGHKSIVTTNKYMHLAPQGAMGAVDLLERLRGSKDEAAPTADTTKVKRRTGAGPKSDGRRRTTRGACPPSVAASS